MEDLCKKIRTRSLRELCQEVGKLALKELPNVADFLNERLLSPYNLCAFVSLCPVDCCGASEKPEQISLSYDSMGRRGAEGLVNPALAVTWIQPASVTAAGQMVQWSTAAAADTVGGKTFSAAAHRTTYTRGGWQGSIWKARMENLEPASTVVYRVGGGSAGWSDWFKTRVPLNQSFALSGNGEEQTLRVAVVADMGAEKESDPTVAAMSRLVGQNQVDLLLHVGDTAYADGVEHQWDSYGRKISPFSTRVPILYAVGNHEIVYNFTAFKARMNNPGKSSGSQTNMYWSADVGSMHVVSLDGEDRHNVPIDFRQDPSQLAWLDQDLALANSASRRSARPWIVALIHRPLYCTTKGGYPPWDGPHPLCWAHAEYLRGVLEPYFLKHGVDLVLSGHAHNYDRFFPHSALKNETLFSYHRPGIPVHTLMGASGCREKLDNAFFEPAPAWSAQRYGNITGYSTLDVNRTAIVYSFFDSETQTLKDQFILTK